MLHNFRFILPALAFVIFCLSTASFAPAQDAKPAAPAAPKITYDEHVRPILREHCFTCHGPDKQESGLQLDSYQKAMAGGSSGEVVLPGDLASSRLWALVSHAEEPKMPPRQDKLASAKLDTISKWIEGGAPENAGSKVVVKKSALAAVAVSAVGKPEGPPPMPAGLLKQPVLYTKRPGQVTALASSPWAPLVAVAGQKQVSLYQPESGELLGILPFPEGIPHVLRFSRNGSVLLAAGGHGGQSGSAVLFDVKTGKRMTTVGEETDTVLAADVNATQTLVALGGPSRVVRIFSAQTGELLHQIRKHTDWIYAVEFSPDGKLLATADRSGGLSVWEAETAREVLDLRGHKGAVYDVSWRLDSGILASAGEDASIKLWDLNEGKTLKSWNAHAGGAFCVRFAHDGRLVTAGRDKTVKTWGADGAAQKTFPSFTEPALRCAFTSDDKLVVAGDWLGNVRLFAAADAKEVRSLAANPPTLEMRLAAAKEELTDKEAAATAAERDVKAATKLAATKAKAHEAAKSASEAIVAAKKALADAPAAAKQAGLSIDKVQAAASAVNAAAAETSAALDRLAKENKAAASHMAEKQKLLAATQSALKTARQKLAAAEADKRAFDSAAQKLTQAD